MRFKLGNNELAALSIVNNATDTCRQNVEIYSVLQEAPNTACTSLWASVGMEN